jgi:hypothetical protein
MWVTLLKDGVEIGRFPQNASISSERDALAAVSYLKSVHDSIQNYENAMLYPTVRKDYDALKVRWINGDYATYYLNGAALLSAEVIKEEDR